MSVSRVFNGPPDGEWLTAPKEKPTDFSALISDDAVGMVQAFIDGRCEVKLDKADIREALEVYLGCTVEEIKARYGIIAVPVQYAPQAAEDRAIKLSPVDSKVLAESLLNEEQIHEAARKLARLDIKPGRIARPKGCGCSYCLKVHRVPWWAAERGIVKRVALVLGSLAALGALVFELWRQGR